MRAVLLSLGVAAALVTSGAGEAAACTCVQGGLVDPRPDAVDVPRNTMIMWSMVGSEAPVLRRADSGDAVELTLEERRYDNHYSPVWFGTPGALLDADVTYEICALVDGVESCHPFTTGGATDDVTPVMGSPTALHAQRLRNVDGTCDARCWGSPSDRLILDHAPASEGGHAIMAVRREAYAELSWSFLVPIGTITERTSVFNTYCGPSVISLEEEVVYCSRITLVDSAGRESAPSPEMCAPATTCETAHCESAVDGTCLALPGPDAGPVEPAPRDEGGCAAANQGGAWLALLALLSLARQRFSTCARQSGSRSR